MQCYKIHKKAKIMETKTISVAVKIPKSYRVGLLQQQLTAYAQVLIAQSKPKKRRYRHEALRGIFNTDATEEELIEDYLQEKYNINNE